MSRPDSEAASKDAASPQALSAAVARQIEVIVTTAEQAASDLTHEVEGAATRHATDIVVEAERKADRILDEATKLSTDYLMASRRQIDDFAAERIRRLSELADGLIEVAETIQARHSQVEELNHRLHELINVVGSAAEAVAREAAQPDPSLPSPPKRSRSAARRGRDGADESRARDADPAGDEEEWPL